MYERTRSPSSGYHGYSNATAKMASDIGPRKTMFVLVVVVGCFAILWPKVFYPMLVGSANQHMKPSPIDKTTGCCDVFSEVDIDTIKIMSELCSTIIQQSSEKPLSGKEIVTRCRSEIQKTCGIDISAMLQEQVRLGRTVKQILNEVRSLNGSLCLKYHYGVAPWRLGVPHRITINFTTNIRQERPPHMRSDIVHPAFRERGSAIPKPPGAPKKPPKIIEGRPGPLPGMRPTLGGAGHVVPPSQKTGSSMSVIMPIYTIGIVIFFTYTLMKLIFKKQPDGVGGSLYPPIEPDPRFRREVFESERCKFTPRLSRDPTGKIVVHAVSALLDEVDEEFEARRKAKAVAKQAKSSSDHSLANGSLANGSVPKQEDQEQTSVKILGMETTASCEGGEKWNKSTEPVVIPVPHPVEPLAPPQEIYLEGALPAQSQILVADSAVVTEAAPSDANSDPAVVLAGKMTLSVISLDSIHDSEKVDEKTEDPIEVEPIDLLEYNGEHENIDDDPIEESKYTTASSATAAENEISEDEGTDNEGAEEDIEKINELELEINHIDVANGPDTKDYEEEEILDKEIREAIEREIARELQEELDRETAEKIQQELEKEIKTETEEKLKEIAETEISQKLYADITREVQAELEKGSARKTEEEQQKDIAQDILQALEAEAVKLPERIVEEEIVQPISKELQHEIEKEIQDELEKEIIELTDTKIGKAVPKEIPKELQPELAKEIKQELEEKEVEVPEQIVEKDVIKEILEKLEQESVERVQEKLEKESVEHIEKEIAKDIQKSPDTQTKTETQKIQQPTHSVGKEIQDDQKKETTKATEKKVEELELEDEEEEEVEEVEEIEVEEDEVEEEEEEIEEEEEEVEEVEIDDDEDVEEIEIEVDEDEVDDHKN